MTKIWADEYSGPTKIWADEYFGPTNNLGRRIVWADKVYVFIFVNAKSMYVQYKVNLSENQVDSLKDAIRLKKGVTLCFPKGGVRVDHVLLLTPVQINRLDKAQTERRRVQFRMSAKQVAKNVRGWTVPETWQ